MTDIHIKNKLLNKIKTKIEKNRNDNIIENEIDSYYAKNDRDLFGTKAI